MSEPRRPLEGIRVLELAQVVAGPFCGALMAEFGAEVIKTEIPGKGDDLRRLGPSEDGTSYWFAVDNRNKKLMTLDLHTPPGQDIVRRLVPALRRRAGELPPGRAGALGPGLGRAPRDQPAAGHGAHHRVRPDGPAAPGPRLRGDRLRVRRHLVPERPRRPPAGAADAGVSRLHDRALHGLRRDGGAAPPRLTGEGQWIDAALYESAFRVLEYTTTLYGRRGVVRERGGLQHAGWPGGAFQTPDGHWVVFTAPAQHLFERLCAMLGQPDLPKDPRFATAAERPRNIPFILDLATAWFAARPFDKAIGGAEGPRHPALAHHEHRRHLCRPALPRAQDDPRRPGRGAGPAAAAGRRAQALAYPRARGSRRGRAWPPHRRDPVGLLGMSPREIAALRAARVV